jgi:hypothetical protein
VLHSEVRAFAVEWFNCGIRCLRLRLRLYPLPAPSHPPHPLRLPTRRAIFSTPFATLASASTTPLAARRSTGEFTRCSLRCRLALPGGRLRRAAPVWRISFATSFTFMSLHSLCVLSFGSGGLRFVRFGAMVESRLLLETSHPPPPTRSHSLRSFTCTWLDLNVQSVPVGRGGVSSRYR